jgi:hypothetical protein
MSNQLSASIKTNVKSTYSGIEKLNFIKRSDLMKFSIGRPHNKMCTPSLHSQSWRVVSLATTELCSHMAKQALEKLTQ